MRPAATIIAVEPGGGCATNRPVAAPRPGARHEEASELTGSPSARPTGYLRAMNAPDSAALVTLARRWLDCFERRALDDLLALYVEEAVHTSPKIRARHPESGGELRGKAALRAWWGDAFARLPGLRYRERTLTADGERVFMEYLRSAPGEPDLPVAEVLEVENGRIVKSRVYHG
jgi:ketosteroid isomerase-like protein